MATPPLARGPSVRTVPEGDTCARLVCPDCGYVVYENPKIIVGAVCRFDGRLLLCRRAIEPRKGFWTIPAGFLELDETVTEGTKREAREEAGAEIEIEDLLAVYSIPKVGHVQLIFRARLLSPVLKPGPESAQVALFAWEELPWTELAFPSVAWALQHYREATEEAGGKAGFMPRTNPPGELGSL